MTIIICALIVYFTRTWQEAIIVSALAGVVFTLLSGHPSAVVGVFAIGMTIAITAIIKGLVFCFLWWRRSRA